RIESLRHPRDGSFAGRDSTNELSIVELRELPLHSHDEGYVQLHLADNRFESRDISNLRKRNGKLHGRLQGWRFGLAIWALASWIVLVLNISLAIYAAYHHISRKGGILTLYQGSCSVVRKRSMIFALVINIMGTTLLAGSNYTMQCLASPTRDEIDTAHTKGDWLEIGVPSIRNLMGRVSWSRTGACFLLGLCSLPTHLLFNSVIFRTATSNSFGTGVAGPAFPDILPPELLQPWSYSCNHTETDYLEDDTYNRTTQIVNFTSTLIPDRSNSYVEDYTNLVRNSTPYPTINLTVEDCLAIYQKAEVSDYGPVVFFIEPHEGDSATGFLFATDSMDYAYQFYGYRTGTTGVHNNVTDLDSVEKAIVSMIPTSEASYWGPVDSPMLLSVNPGCDSPQTYNVSYCLAMKVPERCEMDISLYILVTVIGCNLFTCATMLWTFWTRKEATMVTVGDAICSYLDMPQRLPRSRNAPSPRARAEKTNRSWVSGTDYGTWASFVFLATISIMIISVWSFTKTGLQLIQDVPNGRSTLSTSNTRPGNDSGFIANAFTLNLPQILLTILCLLCNKALSGMLMAREWIAFSSTRKALRVTDPRGDQQSTYFLSMPYQYAIPLLLASVLLHWIMSQCFFLISIKTVFYSRTGMILSQSVVSKIGIGPWAASVAAILLSVTLIVMTTISCRSFHGGMPIVGCSSLAIARNANRGEDDVDAAYLPLKWGKSAESASSARCKCIFSSQDCSTCKHTTQSESSTRRERSNGAQTRPRTRLRLSVIASIAAGGSCVFNAMSLFWAITNSQNQ
ncbi:hypothetical protein HII31_06145, partial [Pseudocercospora fuligena]